MNDVDISHADGQRVTVEGAPALRFERALAHSPEAVWRALVEKEALARWMQANATVDQAVGGRFHLSFHSFDHAMLGRITRWEPPHVLEYTWPEPQAGGDSIVRFELSPTQGGCRLALTHILRAGGDMADFASGWHWHLDALQGALLGRATVFDRARWAALREHYIGRL